jgi:hypothetical protein
VFVPDGITQIVLYAVVQVMLTARSPMITQLAMVLPVVDVHASKDGFERGK